MKTCIQCGRETEYDYCQYCGQKQNIPRLTLKFFFADFLDRIYGLDGALPKTVLGMFKNPGHVIKEYVSGVRRKYVGPVGFYFLMYATFLIMFPLLGMEINDYMPSQENFNTPIEEMTGQEMGEEVVQSQNEFRQKLFDNIQFFIIFWFPFIAIWGKILFRSSGFNFLENMVFAFFVSGQTTIFNMIAVLFYAITDNKSMGVVMIIGIAYFCWAGASYFGGKSKIKSFFKSLLLWFLSYLSFMLTFMILVFLTGFILAVLGFIE